MPTLCDSGLVLLASPIDYPVPSATLALYVQFVPHSLSPEVYRLGGIISLMLKFVNRLIQKLALARRGAPIWKIWQMAKTGEIERAAAACELLPEPQRWSLLTAMAGHFAEVKDGPRFDCVWPLVLKHAGQAANCGDIPDAALARCAAFRPACLVEVARIAADRAMGAFAILARRAPVEAVAAVFEAVESARLNVPLSDALIWPAARLGRADLVMSCVRLIRDAFSGQHWNGSTYVIEPKERRDALRSRVVQGLVHHRRFEEALTILTTFEDDAQRVSNAVSVYVEMGESLKALEVLREFDAEPCILIFSELSNALGGLGEVNGVLEVADIAQRYHGRSFAADVLKNGCDSALKKDHVSAVAAVLDRISPSRLRKKIEEQLARAGNRSEPKTLRGRVSSWVEQHPSKMAEVIARIRDEMSSARPADRIFLLIGLLRAQAKAGLSSEARQTLAQVEESLRAISRRALRIEATQEAAAALIAMGERGEALRIMDAMPDAVGLSDKDEIREFVGGFVAACAALNAKHHLLHLSKEERDDTGFGLFIEEAMTWQAADSVEVEQLVARARKTNDFYDVIETLRAFRKFSQASAVLRHAPNPRMVVDERSSLLEEAADFGQYNVVLEILATIESPVPGAHPRGTDARDLLRSYVFRSAYGIPGGMLEHLIHALSESLDSAVYDFS